VKGGMQVLMLLLLQGQSLTIGEIMLFIEE
jgi:hypothetical protein